ncbi:MAG: hypothetical protein Q7T20_11050 [Saprospiraceae bacterium]|nr:hypothetical protein [Saprospiraceae bacterium]
MNKNLLKLKSPWAFFWALMIFQSVSAQQSTFSLNDEGWRVVGDAQGPSTIPNYDSMGGNPGGYCHAVDDVSGDYWYWSAPVCFKGWPYTDTK